MATKLKMAHTPAPPGTQVAGMVPPSGSSGSNISVQNLDAKDAKVKSWQQNPHGSKTEITWYTFLAPCSKKNWTAISAKNIKAMMILAKIPKACDVFTAVPKCVDAGYRMQPWILWSISYTGVENNPHAYIWSSGDDVAPDKIKVHRSIVINDKATDVKDATRATHLQNKKRRDRLVWVSLWKHPTVAVVGTFFCWTLSNYSP